MIVCVNLLCVDLRGSIDLDVDVSIFYVVRIFRRFLIVCNGPLDLPVNKKIKGLNRQACVSCLVCS